jgi:hypothetical protein
MEKFFDTSVYVGLESEVFFAGVLNSVNFT